MEEGRGSGDERHERLGKFLEKLSSTGVEGRCSFNLDELRILVYLDRMDTFVRDFFETVDRGLYDDLLIKGGTLAISEELDLSRRKIYSSVRKLRKDGFVERSEHSYYKGRVYLRVTDKGKAFCDLFI